MTRSAPRLTLLLALLLSACLPTPPDAPIARATVQLDYAPTSLGFRNSGALSAGRLMLWDRTAGTLADIGADIPLEVAESTTPTTLEATYLDAVRLSTNLTLTDSLKAEAGAAVSQNLRFTVEDAVRQTSRTPEATLARSFAALEAAGEDPASAWRLDEVLAAPDRLAYVLLTDPVLAKGETVRFAGESSASGELTLTDAVAGKITLALPRDASASCRTASEARATCFINARVLAPNRRADGRVSFRAVPADRIELAKALRQK